jgi:hypothetical protein
MNKFITLSGVIVLLAEDLQSSTGAYGGIAWFYAARALNDSKGARIYTSTTRTSQWR